MTARPTRISPGPGQESVWDYPRPPRLERIAARLRVVFAGATVADTVYGWRVLETSHPPVYYFPPEDVRVDYLEPVAGRSFCEFKGTARYWSVAIDGRRAERAAWSYADPSAAFAVLLDHFAFYAARVDACWVDDEQVQAQPGDFYGGWVTATVVGPFKGDPGTLGW